MARWMRLEPYCVVAAYNCPVLGGGTRKSRRTCSLFIVGVWVMVEVEVERNGLNFRIGKVEQGHMILSDFELT